MKAPAATEARRAIACLASAPSNPYLRLLYDHLRDAGVPKTAEADFRAGWLWRKRRTVGYLHFHWPEGHYRHDSGPALLRPALGRVKLALFAGRLAAARLLGYRLIWTIHQVYPHESTSRGQDRVAARLLGRACHVFIAHDRVTAEAAERELRRPAGSVHVVPHGSYIGVYPAGRERAAVRRELGLGDDAFVFLAFGELRLYKGIDLLLRAWAETDIENGALVVAGNPKDKATEAAVRAAAASDARIVPLLGFQEDAAVFELFNAADAAVLARGDGGTSGSLILALSLGTPVVFAERPAYLELLHGATGGWSFRADDSGSLAAALAGAASDRREAAARGSAALALAHTLDWDVIASTTAALLDAQPRRNGASPARAPNVGSG